MRMNNGAVIAAAAACCLLGASQAHAFTLGFSAIIENGDGASEFANHASAEAQLFVDVTDSGPGTVLFTFRNVGPTAMFIDGVYFDDGTLLGISKLFDSDENGGDAGVDYTGASASPPDLPGGNNVGFQTTAGFLADADPPGGGGNGVDPGESFAIKFDLINGKNFADVLAALEQGFGIGGLVIGIKVQGFPDGGSEAFINGGPPVIPLPPSVALGLAGLAPIMTRRRRA